MYKTVIFPITVSEGGYCYKSQEFICPYIIFDSGFPSCLLDFDPKREPLSTNVLKDPECFKLEELKE